MSIKPSPKEEKRFPTEVVNVIIRWLMATLVTGGEVEKERLDLIH